MAGNVHALRPKTATLDLGLRHFTREDLEKVHAAGQTLDIHVLGLASIADDVTPDLARATITSIEVLGALHASAEVKAALPIEATRLTREGHLTEATALLQRMLQSGMEPDARPGRARAARAPRS
jgi:pentatricopeptide repeat protein